MNGRLRREDGFEGRGDEWYELFLDLHAGLPPEESEAVNARLLLILANHIGDLEVLSEAVELAGSYGRRSRRESVAPAQPATENGG